MSGMGETLTNADACYKNTSDVNSCYYCYASARGLGAKDVNGAGKYIFEHCVTKAVLKRGATSSVGMSIAPKQVGVSGVDMGFLNKLYADPVISPVVGAGIGYGIGRDVKSLLIGMLAGAAVSQYFGNMACNNISNLEKIQKSFEKSFNQ